MSYFCDIQTGKPNPDRYTYMLSEINAIRALLPTGSKLVAVSKMRSAAEIETAFEHGLTDFGENYLQEALPKIQQLAHLDICWHYIGKIQSKKINDLIGNFDLLHTVDSLKVAEKINKKCEALGKSQNVLVQTNFSGEATKSGISMEHFVAHLSELLNLPHLRVLGVMEMPPLASAEQSEKFFRGYINEVQKIADSVNWKIEIWSLGTSGDFREAVKAGSNCVRIGTAIFGPRQAQNSSSEGDRT